MKPIRLPSSSGFIREGAGSPLFGHDGIDMSDNAADYSSSRRSSVYYDAIVRDFCTVLPGFQVREDKVSGERAKIYAIISLAVIFVVLLPLIASFSIALRHVECLIYLIVSLATIYLTMVYTVNKTTGYIMTEMYAIDDMPIRTNYVVLAADAVALTALCVVMAACLLFAAGRLVVSNEWVDLSQELASAPTSQQVDVVTKAVCRRNGQIVGEWHFARDEHGSVLQVDGTVSDYSECFELDANGYPEAMRPYVEALPRLLICSETSGPSANGTEQEQDGETLKSYEARFQTKMRDMGGTRTVTPLLNGEFTYYANGRLQNEIMRANTDVGGFIAQYDEQGNVTNLSFGYYKLQKDGKPQLDFEYLRDDKGNVTGLATDVPFFDGKTNLEETRLVVETTTDGAGNVLTASWEDMTWEFSYERVDNPSPAVLMSPRPLSTLMEVYFIDTLPVGAGYDPLPYSPAFPIAVLFRESML